MSNKNKKHKERTYARNRNISRRGYEKIFESDGEYLLKLVLCVLLASFWLKFHEPIMLGAVPLNAFPLGFILGMILVGKFERFQADRKIWYAILIIVAIITYFMPAGIVL